MPEMIKIAPAPGARVRKPDKSVLADAGESVARDAYWDRRVAHGDVVVLDDEPATRKETGK